MIRCILVVLIIALFLILGLPLLLFETVLGKFNEPLMRSSSLRIVQFMFRLILKVAGARVTVIGQENIPTDQPVLYVSNHRSYFDILVGYISVVGLCGFIAKKEINSVPILNLWMRKLHCLFLDRSSLRAGLDTILKAIEQVKQGISIFIFPEGTRSQGDEMLPFKEGGMKISEKTGCPVIPVAILGTDNIFENHIPFVRPADVTICFGEPIYTAQLERAEKKHLGERCRGIIEGMLTELLQKQ